MLRPFLLAAVVFGSWTLAQNAKFCPQAESDICYSASVPDSTVSSGSGDVYFQIQGPASKRWIGLGQGSRMSGANIFVIYPSADGTNVTLSPRDGRGHFQPQYDGGIQASLLEGSGIANGKMTANVRCSSCLKWQQSTLDVKSTSSNWIWAAQSGSTLKSDSQDADLGQQVHSGFGQFTFDLTKAQSGNSLNPFVAAVAATPVATGASPSATSIGSSSGTNAQDSSASTGGGSSGATSSSASSSSGSGSQERRPNQRRHKILIAHGVIMSLAWVIVFPLGAILIRALSARSTVRVHASTQAFAYLLALAGMALGVYVAVTPEYQLDMYHPVIGLLVVALATVQPVLGAVHHRIYKAKGERTWWATAHVALGRVVITLAIINGGLGLMMAGNTRKGEIAYGVIAGVVWLVWMVFAVRAEVQKTKDRGRKGGVEKGSPRGSP